MRAAARWTFSTGWRLLYKIDPLICCSPPLTHHPNAGHHDRITNRCMLPKYRPTRDTLHRRWWLSTRWKPVQRWFLCTSPFCDQNTIPSGVCPAFFCKRFPLPTKRPECPPAHRRLDLLSSCIKCKTVQKTKPLQSNPLCSSFVFILFQKILVSLCLFQSPLKQADHTQILPACRSICIYPYESVA